MSVQTAKISNAFLTFRDEAGQQAMAWAELVQKLGQASCSPVCGHILEKLRTILRGDR